MARIQVLPLPPIEVGDEGRTHTPFILIIDQMAGERETWHEADLETIKANTGASLVIFHEGTFDAEGHLELIDEQQDTLTNYITQPLRVTLGAN